MSDVLITPASGKIEFFDGSSNLDAKIEIDGSGNLLITNPGGDISLGDTTADVFIGDGVNTIDIRFEQAGTITGQSGVTLTIGESNSNVSMGTTLNLNSNDVTNGGSITATSFSGNGAAITSINATNLASGTVPTARLGSGTANSTTYLAGDQTWKEIATGGGGAAFSAF